MIYVGIDVAKDKHDCCILGPDGEILFSPFTIQNSLTGYDELYEKIWSLTSDLTEVRTTGLAGGLLSPYKGLVPACARKAH